MSVKLAPPVRKCKRFATGILLGILTATYAGGCSSAPVTKQEAVYRLALVSETYAKALKRLSDWEINQRAAGAIPEADHVVWRRRLDKLALAGKAANDAIRVASMSEVQTQARAIVDILEELVEEQVIRLNAEQRTTATLVIEALRVAVLVWSSTLSVDRIGTPAEFDAIVSHSDIVYAEAN